MTNEQLNDLYEAIKAKLERGEEVSVLEEFLYETEAKRRKDGPNDLEKQSAKRGENPLRRGVKIAP